MNFRSLKAVLCILPLALLAVFLWTRAEKTRALRSTAAAPAAEMTSPALLAKYYPHKPEAPRGIKAEIVRTAEGFAPRFDGEIEPHINDPKSRWKNPAKPVLPVFPRTFDGAMSVRSTFDKVGRFSKSPSSNLQTDVAQVSNSRTGDLENRPWCL